MEQGVDCTKKTEWEGKESRKQLKNFNTKKGKLSRLK